jgi:hypothetical protein
VKEKSEYGSVVLPGWAVAIPRDFRLGFTSALLWQTNKTSKHERERLLLIALNLSTALQPLWTLAAFSVS